MHISDFSIITKVTAFSFVLVTVGAVWQSTTIYLKDSGVVASAVSTNASVEENSFNALNAQLQKKEAELRQQEIELLTTEREREQRMMAIIFAISAALFILIAMNFYLDYRRYHLRLRRT